MCLIIYFIAYTLEKTNSYKNMSLHVIYNHFSNNSQALLVIFNVSFHNTIK